MLNNTFARQQFDVLSTSAQAASRAFAEIMQETSNFSRASMQRGAAFVGKLAAAEGLDDKIQVQNDYVLSAYEAAVEHARSVKSAFEAAVTQVRNGINTLSDEAVAQLTNIDEEMARIEEAVAQMTKLNVPVVNKAPTKAPGASKARTRSVFHPTRGSRE
jgi:Phasin protein